MTVEINPQDAPVLQAGFTGIIMRYKFTWTGGSIGTGYTTFFGKGTGSQAFADGAAAFMLAACQTGASSAIPNAIIVTPDSFVDLLQADTGSLWDSQGITVPSTIVGGNSQAYAAGVGACVTWATAGVVGGQRVRGRTFVAPLSSTKYDTAGTLDNSYRTSLLAAANTYRAGSWLPVIWHRPVNGAGGEAHDITAASSRDRVSILTSRR